MNGKFWSRIAMFPPLLAIAACSVMPGLHPRVPSGGMDPARPEFGEVVKVSGGGAITEIRVITVTPRNLLTIASSSETSKQNPELPGTSSAEDYVIGPGDIVNIIVWDHPELTNPTGEFRDPVTAGRLVDAGGMMFYPYVGEFKASGLTVGQLRSLISQHLAKVIAKPQVDARIVAFRSKRVQVAGEVRQPGLVALDDTLKGIVEAISERGGLTENASRRRVQLSRNGLVYTLNLPTLLAGDTSAKNPVLSPGDVVNVPDRSDDQVFVLGEVNKEGPVFLQQQRTTLMEALTNAGGLTKSGSDDSGVLVFRKASAAGGVAAVYRVSLADAVGMLVAGEFALEPRDIVYVSATAFSQYNSIINQLLPTISAVFQVDALVRRR